MAVADVDLNESFLTARSFSSSTGLPTPTSRCARLYRCTSMLPDLASAKSQTSSSSRCSTPSTSFSPTPILSRCPSLPPSNTRVTKLPLLRLAEQLKLLRDSDDSVTSRSGPQRRQSFVEPNLEEFGRLATDSHGSSRNSSKKSSQDFSSDTHVRRESSKKSSQDRSESRTRNKPPLIRSSSRRTESGRSSAWSSSCRTLSAQRQQPPANGVSSRARSPAIVTAGEKEAAIKALAKSIGPTRQFQDILNVLLEEVVLCDDDGALSQEAVSEVVNRVLQDECAVVTPADMQCKANNASLTMKALRILIEQAGKNLDDIMGQILWRHRRAEVLQDRVYQRMLEDITWATGNKTEKEGCILQGVEDVFRILSAGDGGRMTSHQWRKVTRLIQKNPVLKEKIKASDIDRLFYLQTHHCGEVQKGISWTKFKELLLEFAECMKVHPYMVLLAVGCSAEHLASEQQKKQLRADSSEVN